ncbi:MAG: hypothetical protein WCJ30_23675 [Deltaproteobacteria bacterium]
MTGSTDEDTLARIRRVVLAGVQSPSAGNWHPWFFERDGTSLKIHFEPKRVESEFDSQNFLSVFTLGMVIESMVVAASAEGFESEGVIEPDGWQTATAPRVLCATVRLTEAEVTPDPLSSAIYARVTDRRVPAGGSIQDSVFQAMRRSAEAHESLRLYLVTAVVDGVVQYMRRQDWAMRQVRALFAFILRPMRLTDASANRTRDGVSWRNFGFGRITSLIVAIGRALPFGAMRWLSRKFDESGPSPMRGSRVLGCVTVRALDTGTLVDAGRLSMRNWLQLTRAGYVIRPHGGPTLLLYMERKRALTAGVADVMGDSIERGHRSMSEMFGFGADETPVWLFTCGTPRTAFPAIARTLRRRLEDTYSE